MKSRYSLAIVCFALVFMLGVASALAAAGPGSTTAIAGKIYNADFSDVVEGATVEVTCNEIQKETTSFEDGAYSVTYSGSDCSEGDTLSVYAYKEGVGENTVEGEIHNNYPLVDLNLGVVNVPLVPEFGALVGVLTLMGALGVFFIVRRK